VNDKSTNKEQRRQKLSQGRQNQPHTLFPTPSCGELPATREALLAAFGFAKLRALLQELLLTLFQQLNFTLQPALCTFQLPCTLLGLLELKSLEHQTKATKSTVGPQATTHTQKMYARRHRASSRVGPTAGSGHGTWQLGPGDLWVLNSSRTP
jgi:hypothetical protein